MNYDNIGSVTAVAVMNSFKNVVLSQWELIEPIPPLFSSGAPTIEGQAKYDFVNASILGVYNAVTIFP